MALKRKSKQVSLVPVSLSERETHVSYSIDDVRHEGMAFVETFEPKLKAKILKAGGRVVREYSTQPPSWGLQVLASKVRISMSRPEKRELSPEAKARLQTNLAKAREAKQSLGVD